MKKPYVISEELGLAGQINRENIDVFRESLDDNLRNMGKMAVWVNEYTIRTGMEELAEQTSLPVLNLDDRYLRNSDEYIGLSRAVVRRGNKYVSSGYASRVGYSSIDDQIAKITQQYAGKELVLADDVVFSGQMIEDLSNMLEKRNIKVRGVIAGIAIGEGVDRVSRLGVDIEAVESFSDVEDELCERDFTLIRGSGRRSAIEPGCVDGANVLYFDPRWGDPVSWMSLPEGQERSFWLQNLRRNQRLLPPERPASTIGPFVGVSQSGSVGGAINELLDEAENGRK
ncbi:hypothetical protein CR983_04340 [Candidatus Saccharibacteria bacterium]|nr:MAG: hypothetical protein CR983_04340 [Candidatus Saccharibacteria bacterium]